MGGPYRGCLRTRTFASQDKCKGWLATCPAPLGLASLLTMSNSPKLPQCWGHRGASAAFPENTLASFEAAFRDGAEGIESDVHVSADDVVIMFHDPSLERTTNGTGLIRNQNWYGEGGMEHVRTKKEPIQPVPTFDQTIELLMKPENRHALFNVDVKVWNDPARLFRLMHATISAQPGWETALAPRIILGLWHPRFLPAALEHVPYLQRAHIGLSPDIAREFFWDTCDSFSMNFRSLCTVAGEKFRRDCAAAGKKVMVWTVNEPHQMIECVRWGVDSILTDTTKTWLDIRKTLEQDTNKTEQYGRMFLWTDWQGYTPVQRFFWSIQRGRLEKIGGPFEKVASDKTETPAKVAVAA